MDQEVRIEHVESLPLAVVKRRVHQSQLSKVVPECCGIVWNVLKAHGVTGAGRNVALYLDGQMNIEVGVEIGDSFAGAGEVSRSATPSGTVAIATHLGPYQRLHEAHDAIHDWCARHGRALAGPSWEIYGHWKDEWNRDPSQIRTDIVYLLK